MRSPVSHISPKKSLQITPKMTPGASQQLSPNRSQVHSKKELSPKTKGSFHQTPSVVTQKRNSALNQADPFEKLRPMEDFCRSSGIFFDDSDRIKM